jgi:hypothetical protein
VCHNLPVRFGGELALPGVASGDGLGKARRLLAVPNQQIRHREVLSHLEHRCAAPEEARHVIDRRE